MSSELDFRIEKLKARPLRIEFEAPTTEFPDLLTLVDQGDVVFLEGVRGVLTAESASGVVEVEGRLATRVQQPCSRCLASVESTVDVKVTLTYVPLGSGAVSSTDVEKELTADEIGLIPCPVDQLDLRPELSQEILMALPQQPICRADCRGLCPSCGADLNEGTCGCEKPVFHDGLAALKNFKIDK